MGASNELLEELKNLLDDGGELPPKVTNRLVLAAVRENYKATISNKNEISSLKLKSSVWGAASGFIGTLGAILVALALSLV